jgi:hypothetical protein
MRCRRRRHGLEASVDEAWSKATRSGVCVCGTNSCTLLVSGARDAVYT